MSESGVTVATALRAILEALEAEELHIASATEGRLAVTTSVLVDAINRVRRLLYGTACVLRDVIGELDAASVAGLGGAVTTLAGAVDALAESSGREVAALAHRLEACEQRLEAHGAHIAPWVAAGVVTKDAMNEHNDRAARKAVTVSREEIRNAMELLRSEVAAPRPPGPIERFGEIIYAITRRRS